MSARFFCESMLDFVRQPPLPFCQVRNSARNRKMENQTIGELAIIQRRSGNENGQKRNDREKTKHPGKRKTRNETRQLKWRRDLARTKYLPQAAQKEENSHSTLRKLCQHETFLAIPTFTHLVLFLLWYQSYANRTIYDGYLPAKVRTCLNCSLLSLSLLSDFGSWQKCFGINVTLSEVVRAGNRQGLLSFKFCPLPTTSLQHIRLFSENSNVHTFQ